MTPVPGRADIEPREPHRRPHPPAGVSDMGDRIFEWVLRAAAAAILAVLAAMVTVLLLQGRESIARFGLGFITNSTWDPVNSVFGAAPAILGTIYTSLLALLLAAPIGLMVAIFLTELAPRRIRFTLGFIVELLAAVPSIVFGLWALYVLVPIVRQDIEPPLTDLFGWTPFFQGYPIGIGVFPAVVILAIMILPTIASISRDVLQAVPNAQREAMLALGATRWEATWRVVVPYARSGIIGAVILGLGRAVGETMAVQMVIGSTQSFSLSLFASGTTLPATIVNQFTEAVGSIYTSALIEIALILMLLAVLLNGLARLLVWRVAKPS